MFFRHTQKKSFFRCISRGNRFQKRLEAGHAPLRVLRLFSPKSGQKVSKKGLFRVFFEVRIGAST